MDTQLEATTKCAHERKASIATGKVRSPRLVSIVAPVFREEAGIRKFASILIEVMDQLKLPYEIIFVEDDSPDRSFEEIRSLYQVRPDVIRALSLSRRFGHQASLAAGFDIAGGDVVICLDSDLQHPPELIPIMLEHWSRGAQLVYTRRSHQQGRGVLKEFASRLFYSAINTLAEVRFEEGAADFRLMDRIVVDALKRFGDRWIVYRGLVQWAGFRRCAIEYDAPQRTFGTSSYTWRRMLNLGLDALFAFSRLPLRVAYVIGGASLAFTASYAIWVLLRWILNGSGVPGYTSLVLLVSFVGSAQLICLGILGEYVGRTHEQVKNRPLYLVKEWLGESLPSPLTGAQRYEQSE